MFRLGYSLLLIATVLSCNKKNQAVDPAFVDSLLNSFSISPDSKTNEADLFFWKSRLNRFPGDPVAAEKYASALSARYGVYGDISDLLLADSLIADLVTRFNEPGHLLTLAGYNMQRHRFNHARIFIDNVIALKAEPYATDLMSFDVNFETGRQVGAIGYLNKYKTRSDFALEFRRSKSAHYDGSINAAIDHMLKASESSNGNDYLKRLALSNAADLYLHKGDVSEASALYRRCIQMDTDFHSLMGLGWIALVHDCNDVLAMKIFEWVHLYSKSPDVLYKMSLAIQLSYPVKSSKFAEKFIATANKAPYGDMYNKYLVCLYLDILDLPAKALEVAEKEITHRATPQTYAWMVRSLYRNGNKQEAYRLFVEKVSGKSLEALELFWMGEMLKAEGKHALSSQYFKAASENKFDLSPAMINKLKQDGF
jgi:tetratricopeptide (TPR) repeat protein